MYCTAIYARKIKIIIGKDFKQRNKEKILTVDLKLVLRTKKSSESFLFTKI